MEKRELELNKKVDAESAALYLEKLAADVRQGEILIAQGVESLRLGSAQDLSMEIKLKIKKARTKLGLSLSWKADSIVERDEGEISEAVSDVITTPGKKEKYKKLKNRMSDNLAAIRNSVVHRKSLPDPEVHEQFCLDARAMCTYRKKGEAFYAEFLDRLEDFTAAYDQQNLAALEKWLRSITDMKERCHEEYK